MLRYRLREVARARQQLQSAIAADDQAQRELALYDREDQLASVGKTTAEAMAVGSAMPAATSHSSARGGATHWGWGSSGDADSFEALAIPDVDDVFSDSGRPPLGTPSARGSTPYLLASHSLHHRAGSAPSHGLPAKTLAIPARQAVSRPFSGAGVPLPLSEAPGAHALSNEHWETVFKISDDRRTCSSAGRPATPSLSPRSSLGVLPSSTWLRDSSRNRASTADDLATRPRAQPPSVLSASGPSRRTAEAEDSASITRADLAKIDRELYSLEIKKCTLEDELQRLTEERDKVRASRQSQREQQLAKERAHATALEDYFSNLAFVDRQWEDEKRAKSAAAKALRMHPPKKKYFCRLMSPWALPTPIDAWQQPPDRSTPRRNKGKSDPYATFEFDDNVSTNGMRDEDPQDRIRASLEAQILATKEEILKMRTQAVSRCEFVQEPEERGVIDRMATDEIGILLALCALVFREHTERNHIIIAHDAEMRREKPIFSTRLDTLWVRSWLPAEMANRRRAVEEAERNIMPFAESRKLLRDVSEAHAEKVRQSLRQQWEQQRAWRTELLAIRKKQLELQRLHRTLKRKAENARPQAAESQQPGELRRHRLGSLYTLSAKQRALYGLAGEQVDPSAIVAKIKADYTEVQLQDLNRREIELKNLLGIKDDGDEATEDTTNP